MFLGVGAVSLLLMVLLALLGFFGLRLAVARAAGVSGWNPVFGFDQKPWADKPLGRRVLFALAGPTGAYLVAALLLGTGFYLAGESVIDETSMRVSVRPGSPAAEAMIEKGDRIVRVDETEITTWDELRDVVSRSRGRRIDVTVIRNGTSVVRPTEVGADGKIGVLPFTEWRQVGLVTSLGRGFVQPFVVLSNAAKGFARLFGGTEKAEFSGPVGIASTVGAAQHDGHGQALLLLGALMSYLLLVPLAILSLVFFPRVRKAS